MSTELYRVLSLLTAALSAYLLAQTGGPIVAAIPLAIGAFLSVAMHEAMRRAPASAWQKKSSHRNRLAGLAYLAAAFAIPSWAIGIMSLGRGPLVTFASLLSAAWLMVWGFSIATRLAQLRRREIT